MAARPRHVTPVTACAMLPGPSRASARSNAGAGGTRLSHTMRSSVGTGGRRFKRRLPTAHEIAEPSVSTKPTSVRSAPTVSAMAARPPRPRIRPHIWRAVGRSCSSSAAKRIVNSACVCTTIDANPGGIPPAIPKN